jgi:Rab9 effector protein with kelch motifs
VKGDCPPSIRAHSAALFNGYVIIVFGGGSWDGQRSVFYNDIYALDTRAHIWTNLTPFLEPGSPVPEPRRAHTAVIRKDRMYVFGGGSGKKSLNDLWVLDLSEALSSRKRLRYINARFRKFALTIIII